MILAINAGYYNTKVKTDAGLFIHPTKVQENVDGSKTLILKDIRYEIGNGNRDITDKQLNQVHDVCTIYNILKHGSISGMHLVACLPMGLYLDRDYRERYKEKWLGIHEGIVDGVDKKVRVERCTVFAEGAAAYLPYKSALKDYAVGILDFGGNTINCMIYAYGELQRDTISTLDLGMIKLERAIIDELNERMHWNVQEYEVREIIKEGEAKEIVEECINRHLEAVKQRLLEKKWNIDRLTIFATGGGSLQLKEYLNKKFNRILVSDNGLWDNVNGLWLVGGALKQ